MTVQVHDLNGGISSNGIFWTVPVPDGSLTRDDGTARFAVDDLPVVDSFQILSGTDSPATASFDYTWTATGSPRHLVPASSDPTDRRNLAAEFKFVNGTGTFSGVTETAFGSGVPFSFEGTGSVLWGEMGQEQNGSFLVSRGRSGGNVNP